MKKVLFAMLVLATVSSCNVQKKVTAFFYEKCAESKVIKIDATHYKVAVKCKHLYDTAPVKKYLSEGVLTYDFVNGELYGTVTSPDSIPNLSAIITGIANGINK